MSYSDFKKCCEKKKKNTKKIRQTLKAHISGTAWQIQLKFGIGDAPPQGNSHRKFRVLLFKECWATDAWKRRFIYSCKIHTCLSLAPGFLGPHDTIPSVLITVNFLLKIRIHKGLAHWDNILDPLNNPVRYLWLGLSNHSVFNLPYLTHSLWLRYDISNVSKNFIEKL